MTRLESSRADVTFGKNDANGESYQSMEDAEFYREVISKQPKYSKRMRLRGFMRKRASEGLFGSLGSA